MDTPRKAETESPPEDGKKVNRAYTNVATKRPQLAISARADMLKERSNRIRRQRGLRTYDIRRDSEIVGLFESAEELDALLPPGQDPVQRKGRLKIVERAVNAGNVKAMVCLGSHLATGALNLPRDLPRAVNLFERAVEAGNVMAMVLLGKMLLNGKGQPKDTRRASELLQRAGELGNAEAMFILGKLRLEGGEGLEKDLPQALTLLSSAGRAGNVKAMEILGKLYLRGDDGLAKDVQGAAKWFELAVKMGGSVEVKVNLGKLLAFGDDGFAKNVPRAVNLFRQAATNVEAKFCLGKLLMQGDDGLSKDVRLAVKWFRRAKEAGSVEAMVSLGAIFASGDEGVPKDMQRAVQLYEQAVDAGSVEAMISLGRLLIGESEEIVTKDPKRAVTLFNRAVDAGSVEAMLSLGELSLHGGEGIQIDEVLAAKLLGQAIRERGDRETANTVVSLFVNENSDSAQASLDRVLGSLKEEVGSDDLKSLIDDVWRDHVAGEHAVADRSIGIINRNWNAECLPRKEPYFRSLLRQDATSLQRCASCGVCFDDKSFLAAHLRVHGGLQVSPIETTPSVEQSELDTSTDIAGNLGADEELICVDAKRSYVQVPGSGNDFIDVARELLGDHGVKLSERDAELLKMLPEHERFKPGCCSSQMEVAGICVEVPKGTRLPPVRPEFAAFTYGPMRRQVLLDVARLTALGFSILSFVLLPGTCNVTPFLNVARELKFKNCLLQRLQRRRDEVMHTDKVVVPLGWLYVLSIPMSFVLDHGEYADMLACVGNGGVCEKTGTAPVSVMAEGMEIDGRTDCHSVAILSAQDEHDQASRVDAAVSGKVRRKIITSDAAQGGVKRAARSVADSTFGAEHSSPSKHLKRDKTFIKDTRPVQTKASSFNSKPFECTSDGGKFNGETWEYLYLDKDYHLVHAILPKDRFYVDEVNAQAKVFGFGGGAGLSRQLKPEWEHVVKEIAASFTTQFIDFSQYVTFPMNYPDASGSLVGRMAWLKTVLAKKAVFPEGENQGFLKHTTGELYKFRKTKVFTASDCRVNGAALELVHGVRQERDGYKMPCRIYLTKANSTGSTMVAPCRPYRGELFMDGPFWPVERLPRTDPLEMDIL